MRLIHSNNTPLILLTVNTDPNFFLLICCNFFFFFFLLILFSLLSMLRTCSGYLGCGLHYGRNGSPQNPFSRKGLYPWAACSGVWHFLWNKTLHTNVCRVFKPLVSSNGSHGDHNPVSNYWNSISRMSLTPRLAATHLLFPQMHKLTRHLPQITQLLVQNTKVTWKNLK